jgi:hypothetical protein
MIAYSILNPLKAWRRHRRIQERLGQISVAQPPATIQFSIVS